MSEVYRPEILDLKKEGDRVRIEELRSRNTINIIDRLSNQIEELLLCRNVQVELEQVRAEQMVAAHLAAAGTDLEHYGVWVYYSWKNMLVHVLDEEEFVEVRTNRNKYKVTDYEQEKLKMSKVGIIGLSVGRIVALAMVTERIIGELRLADYDSIELSNLNRMSTSIVNLGQNKTISLAREISEIDPFICVKCYEKGLTKNNIAEFLSKDSYIDLLIDECDDIEIKVLARLAAKEFQIPVIMETNDQCQIDIERFDKEHDRPIFHGNVVIDQDWVAPISFDKKLDFLEKIINIKTISQGMQNSLPHIGKDIRSWPQLASEVYMGSGVLATAAKNILLGKSVCSGTYFFKTTF